MTIRSEPTLFCDRCGDWTQASDELTPNAREIRRWAKKNGWSRAEGKDYCPTCPVVSPGEQP